MEPLVSGIDVLMLDSLSTLAEAAKKIPPRTGSRSKTGYCGSGEWARQPRCFTMREKAARNAAPRNGKNVLDTVLRLRHPTDYSPAEGARFEVISRNAVLCWVSQQSLSRRGWKRLTGGRSRTKNGSQRNPPMHSGDEQPKSSPSHVIAVDSAKEFRARRSDHPLHRTSWLRLAERATSSARVIRNRPARMLKWRGFQPVSRPD